MGSTAATTAGLFGFGPKGNKYRMKQGMDKALANANEASAALTPPTLPKPPSALDGQITASAAMSAAANRVRRQKGGGLSSTMRTGAGGDPSQAPMLKKSLLGQ